MTKNDRESPMPKASRGDICGVLVLVRKRGDSGVGVSLSALLRDGSWGIVSTREIAGRSPTLGEVNDIVASFSSELNTALITALGSQVSWGL